MKKIILAISICLTSAIAQTKPDAETKNVSVTDAEKIRIREAQLAASEDQVRYASAILAMQDAKTRADSSQQNQNRIVAEIESIHGCQIDLSKANCQPKKPKPVESEKK